MKRRAAYIKVLQALAAGSLLLQLFIISLPSYGAVTSWQQFSDSMNYSFSGGRNNIIVVTIAILTFLIIIIAFRYYFAREEKAQNLSRKLYQQKRQAQTNQNSQQRRWFRLKTNAEFRWIPVNLSSNVPESRFICDQLVDISGGGLCFSTAELLNPGDEIQFILNTGEGKPMNLYGIVARIFEDENELNHNVSIQFAGLRTGERDRIVSWIMKRQRDVIHEEENEEPGSLFEQIENEENNKTTAQDNL